ncbi:glycosyltransferase family 4 protein [candidate division KSB1 bacterium]|nr:glycosyltransferase family 4 protein [candidate division KSB1 bacterium]NIR69700.1 glycosyltransferase family 4 protein [candidate division KSB1 bacterium]NIS24896.1 glycosyltransferase family 4 protein [candidate division KSB1 bacterium]NIT69745.1 glycosyltransferase family 4 protein [candidate division KSB1 bacterium]NIU23415.1 glycosyltransferase family 4 protein [candidate division KSB1 bacterium]
MPELQAKESTQQRTQLLHSSKERQKLKVAYTLSRFPKLTETFILYEILALEKLGVQVELFPLLYERQSVVHPEAAKMLKRANFYPFISLSILSAHLHYLRCKPRTYFSVLWQVLRGTFGSLNFFIGAIGIFPKSVKMAYEMEMRGVNHLHAHFCTHPAVAALIVKGLTGIPFSFTAHGSDVHVERRMLDKKIEAARFAVTVSDFNKNVMIEECGEQVGDKIKVVHCGVDPDEFIPNSKQKEDRPLRIICVASFEEVKGHKYLVEAFEILNRKGVEFRCDLIGYGPLKKKVRAQIRKAGLEDKVVVHKPRPRAEIVQMLREAHLKVLPSVRTKRGKREGIPVVLMEAMASALPVVSSRLSGIPELVEHNKTGLLVEPRDVQGLANAILKLVHDRKLRKTMGAAGREKVLREFDLRKNAEELSKLFLSNIDQTPRSENGTHIPRWMDKS